MTPLERKILVVRATALVGAVGAACFLVSNVVVNLLQPEFDPANTFVSDLVWGRVGWLMTASFLMHGVAILALAIALRMGVVAVPTQRWASNLMVAGGAGVFLLGFFPTDPAGQVSWVGVTHMALAGSAFGALVASFVLFSHSFSHDEHWGNARAGSMALGVLSAFAYLVFLALLGSTHIRSEAELIQGASERLLIGVILLWILVVALRLRRVACDPEHFEDDGEKVRAV